MVTLDQAANEEILWWRDHLHAWNGRALFQDPVDLVIETDFSRKGWGAYCQGVSTGGPWSFEEKRLHINCFELLAGSLAMKTFTKSKVCAHVKLLMDSTSAVAYINGRYTFEKFSEFSNRSVGMVLPKSLDSVSPASPRAFECESRQGVQGFRGLQRLEIEPRHFPDITKQVGSVRGRPFRIPTNKTIAQICQLEARPNGSLHGCLLTGLWANTRVCFSPIRFN